MNRLMLALLFLLAPFTCFGDTPELAGSVQLPGPPTASVASADGRLLAIMLQAKDKQPAGLQIVDTSDLAHPKLMGFTPIPYSGRLAISDDGKTALLLALAEKGGVGKEAGYELIAIDLADASRPRWLWRRHIGAQKVVLSASANAYAYSGLANAKGKREITVVFLRKDQAQVTLEEPEYSRGEFYLSPHAAFLAQVVYGELYAWDLRTGAPTHYGQAHDDPIQPRYDCISAMLDDGHIVVQDRRAPHFGIYEVSPGIPRVAMLPFGETAYRFEWGCSQWKQNAPGNKFIHEEEDGGLQLLDLATPKTPAMSKHWQLAPGTHPIAYAANTLFAMTLGENILLNTYRLDRKGKETLDWQTLARAHAAAMGKYSADVRAKKSIPALEALRSLEQSGILSAVDAPPEGITRARAAAILNDYGFLLTRGRRTPGAAAHVLKRAIKLDPGRALAHLNLADTLRAQLAVASAYGGDADAMRREIDAHYRAYLRLGGQTTPAIDAFLAGDPAQNVQNDACAAIAAYANAGRLNEILSNGGTGIPYRGGKIDLTLTTQGTGHFVFMRAYDTGTDFPLSENSMPPYPPNADGACCGSELGLAIYRHEAHIVLYNDLQHPLSSISLATGLSCKFSVATTESVGPDATEKDLCENLLQGKGPRELAFTKESPMERRFMREWGYTSVDGVRKLDYANNGKPVNVARITFSTVGGMSCEGVVYDTVNADATEFATGPERDLLLQLQQAIPGERRPASCGNKPRFFSYNNKVYFETKPAIWPPANNGDLYHRVATATDGKVREVCDFRFESTVTGEKSRQKPRENKRGN